MAEFKEVIKKRNEICKSHNECPMCPLFGFECSIVRSENLEVLEEIIMNWEKPSKPFDWSKVEVDTKIFVRMSGNGKWTKRHFAKYEDGKVYAFKNGETSWTAHSSIYWNQAKLADEEE